MTSRPALTAPAVTSWETKAREAIFGAELEEEPPQLRRNAGKINDNKNGTLFKPGNSNSIAG